MDTIRDIIYMLSTEVSSFECKRFGRVVTWYNIGFPIYTVEVQQDYVLCLNVHFKAILIKGARQSTGNVFCCYGTASLIMYTV